MLHHRNTNLIGKSVDFNLQSKYSLFCCAAEEWVFFFCDILGSMRNEFTQSGAPKYVCYSRNLEPYG